MPNMSHCQITCSTRFVRHVGIIKLNLNPTTKTTEIVQFEKLFVLFRDTLHQSRTPDDINRVIIDHRLSHAKFGPEVAYVASFAGLGSAYGF